MSLLKMNLDTLSYMGVIKKAANRVQSSSIGGTWMLLGYAEGDEGAKKLNLMTINVIKEGCIWRDLLVSFEDDQIMYAYVKLDGETSGNTKIFLIHWVGHKVGENEKCTCMPHLTEVRNLLPSYDFLVNSMDPLDIQTQVYNCLSRVMQVDADTSKRERRPHSNSELVPYTPLKPRSRSKISKRDKQSFRNTCIIDSIFDFSTEESDDFVHIQGFQTQSIQLPKFKVCIIGSNAVGKSSIYLSYSEGGSALAAPHLIVQTLQPDFMKKKVKVGQQLLNLEIWDTAGNEKFMAFSSAWTRNSNVVIIVYDITERDSFSDVPTWLDKAQQFADSNAIYVLVGNKADLAARRVVTEETAEKFAVQHGMVFMECSGLTGYNILKLFEHISRMLVIVYPDLLSSIKSVGHTDNTIHLGRGTSSRSSGHKVSGCNQCK